MASSVPTTVHASQSRSAAAADTAPSATTRERRLRLVLLALLTGQFMAILDATIVNVATPTIRADLHTSGAELQLIVAGYTIAYAVLLITGARLGALVGYRELFVIGLAMFTAASFACGLAPTSQLLIAFRGVQGAGAAMMVPQVFSLIQRSFEGAARARALSLYATVIAIGSLVGQVLGGALVTANILGTGWRPVFLVNVPIGIVLIVASIRIIPRHDRDTSRGLDPAGLVTLASSVLLLVVPLVLGHEEGWPAWTYASLAASAVMFVVFMLVERSVASRGGSPLVPTRILRAPSILPSIGALFLGMAAFGGFLFSFAQHLQAGLGEAAVQAGFTFAPAALGFAVSSLNWRRLPATWHRPMIPIGFAVAAVGYAATGIALGNGSPDGIVLPLALLTAGLGMGVAFSPVLTVALARVAPADASDASGILTTVIQLGQVVGIATFGSMFFSLVKPGVRPGIIVSGPAIGTTLDLVTVAMVFCAAAALPLLRSTIAVAGGVGAGPASSTLSMPSDGMSGTRAQADPGALPAPLAVPPLAGPATSWARALGRPGEPALGVEFFRPDAADDDDSWGDGPAAAVDAF